MITGSVRAKIRDGDPEYAVTAHSWPHFVYANFEAHANDMEKGLLRSPLLVKVCALSITIMKLLKIDRRISIYLRHLPLFTKMIPMTQLP
jgi:hypothetical protein